MIALLFLALAQAEPAPAITSIDVTACLGQAEIAADLPRLALSRAEAGPQAWSAACRDARAANNRRKALTDTLLNRRAAVAGWESTAGFVRERDQATDPVLRSLFSRAASDQAAREALSARAKASYADGLSKLAQSLLNGLISAEAVATDASNRQWLEETVKARGWFSIERDGARADAAAWLLVQHGDADPSYQKRMIDLLEPLAARGASSPTRFAHLYDRWAAAQGVPQRFGLQGRCVAGLWMPDPMQEPAGVEARRVAAGLEPMEAQIRSKSASCPN